MSWRKTTLPKILKQGIARQWHFPQYQCGARSAFWAVASESREVLTPARSNQKGYITFALIFFSQNQLSLFMDPAFIATKSTKAHLASVNFSISDQELEVLPCLETACRVGAAPQQKAQCYWNRPLPFLVSTDGQTQGPLCLKTTHQHHKRSEFTARRTDDRTPS